ncbi:tRNA (adenosine(37)-N6)-dimethylallyltransferase MiaA [Aliikangiella sp. IMCC44632]
MKNSQLKPVVFIMGPTAAGKTALAMSLYQSGGFEIISVDSAMVYRDMNIGSAKPSAQELAVAPHHLIDFLDPNVAYSAADFSADAKRLINEIHARNKIPLLTGGSMLYFKALQQGLADLPSADPSLRKQLAERLKNEGIESLHAQLADVDPVTAERLHHSDTQRILRALEVYHVSQKPLSQWHQEQSLQALANPVLAIALAPKERAVLHKRIAQRFDLMLKQGLVDEVKALYNRGDLSLDCPSMKSVGYRQIWQYLEGEMSLPQATERAIIATRQLAKRQYTWLRSWPDVEWFDPLESEQLNAAEQRIYHFISDKNRTE